MRAYNFNGHKLAYHPARVAQYLEKGDCMPLYAEISLAGSCNHRCLFCAYDFIGHPKRRLETQVMKACIDDMAACGVKSVVLAGEGEPLLHPDIAEIVTYIKSQGVDVGLFTNGQLLGNDLASSILPHLTFVRFSFNGGTAQDYATVHQVKPDVFEGVMENMAGAVEIKKKKKLAVDIGAQYVLIAENQASVYNAAEAVKRAGIDYLALKPFVRQRREQRYTATHTLDPNDLEHLFVQAERLGNDRFTVVVRRDGFLNPGQRRYAHCRGCAFITVINSAGDVATCLPYWDKPEFVYGNIYRRSFSDIWKGSRRSALQNHLEKELDAQSCPANCRPHAVNAYLSELCNPSVRHLNFI